MGKGVREACGVGVEWARRGNVRKMRKRRLYMCLHEGEEEEKERKEVKRRGGC